MNYLTKANDIIVNLEKDNVVLITKNELSKFIKQVQGKQYVNRSQARKLTNLSYIGNVDSSSKIVKGVKYDYHTYIIYLYSWKNIFGNVCPRGEHCNEPCLNFSGRVKMDRDERTILRARYFKTMLWYVNRDYFVSWISDEIQSAHNKFGDKLMVRLNGTSDLSPELFRVGNNTLIERFPTVQFYDYTKMPNRLKLLAKYSNYHITWSYDGYNIKESKQAMMLGCNVAVVFNGPMPNTFWGRKVFSMDDTDLRPLDKHKGCVGYLKLKETINKKYNTKFIQNGI